MFLAHITARVVIFITFTSILTFSWMDAICNYDVNTTQYDVINSRCAPQKKHLWTTIYSPGVIFLTSIAAELLMGQKTKSSRTR